MCLLENDTHVANYCPFKVPLWSNCRYPFFYIFVHSTSSQDILPNFNLLRSIERTSFGPLFLWICGRHWFSLFQFLVENWRKWRHILKNTARIEIIITITMQNCTNTGAKVFVLFRANCCSNCYYNFNPCGIFENMTSFTPILKEELEQGKLMGALNSRK